MATKVPLHAPSLGPRDWRRVRECLESTWVSSGGRFGERFERAIARRLDVRHAVAVVNGTAGLHLALEAAGVRAGCEVLVPSLTFIATANAAVYLGALPRFVDVEEPTLGMDPDVIEDYLKRRARVSSGHCLDRASGRRIAACLPVWAAGHPPRLDRLSEVCAKFRIPLVEDAAEGLGSSYRGRAAGTWGRAGVLSFNGNKIITTGGGGMVVTDDAKLAARVRHLSTQAKADSRTYRHDAVGFNYRLPSLNAALGLAQLARFDAILAAKRRIAGWYRESLDSRPDLRLLWEPAGARSNFWLNTVRARTAAQARGLCRKLERAGFEARPLWTPCHRQNIFSPLLTAGPLPVTDRLWETCLNLPSSPGLSRQTVLAAAKVLAPHRAGGR